MAADINMVSPFTVLVRASDIINRRYVAETLLAAFVIGFVNRFALRRNNSKKQSTRGRNCSVL
jgi:hypothetical protein